MLKSFKFWVRAAAVVQLVTGLAHSISLFVPMQGTNETENQMLSLMSTYAMDMGAGYTPTMMNVYLALSSCFTFLYVFGGAINLYLLKRLPSENWRGYLGINILVFGACAGVMFRFTFLPPIVLTALATVFLLISYFLTPGGSKK